MFEWIVPLRWVHVIGASAWFGEVVVINFVLLPALTKSTGEVRKQFLNTVFPRVFRLASILSATTVISGTALLYLYTQGNLTTLPDSRWGICILIGGSMGLLLTTFHFFLENVLARRMGIGKPGMSDEVTEDIHEKLRIVPRIGLGVITMIFLLMMFAVRGI